MKRYVGFLLALSVIVALLLAVGLVINKQVSTAAAHEVKLVIPGGTAMHLSMGHEMPLPEKIELMVGDVLVIENQDAEGHQIGDFWVGPGETLRQTMTTPAEYDSHCELHSGLKVQIIVKEG